jgi:hypothetical protein
MSMRVRAWGPLLALLALFAASLTGVVIQYSKSNNQSEPTKTEKRDSPVAKAVIPTTSDQGDKKGKDEKRWTDPLLVLFNGLLTLFTWLLYRATRGLFVETAGLREAAAEQSRDMKTSLVIAKEVAEANKVAAEAAKTSADVAKQALYATRADMAWSDYLVSPVIDNITKKLTGWNFIPVFKNTGSTPARQVLAYGAAKELPIGVAAKFERPPEDSLTHHRPGTSVGAGLPMQGAVTFVPVGACASAINGKIKIYMWDCVEYRDIFEPDIFHHTEATVELEFTRDPTVIDDIKAPPFRYRHVAGGSIAD